MFLLHTSYTQVIDIFLVPLCVWSTDRRHRFRNVVYEMICQHCINLMNLQYFTHTKNKAGCAVHPTELRTVLHQYVFRFSLLYDFCAPLTFSTKKVSTLYQKSVIEENKMIRKRGCVPKQPIVGMNKRTRTATKKLCESDTNMDSSEELSTNDKSDPVKKTGRRITKTSLPVKAVEGMIKYQIKLNSMN